MVLKAWSLPSIPNICVRPPQFEFYHLEAYPYHMMINDTLSSISELYSTGDLDECSLKLKFLLNKITEQVKNGISSEIDEHFYEELLKIVEVENTLLHEWQLQRSLSHLEALTLVLKCLRNSFYKSPKRQNYIVSNEKRRNILLSLLNSIMACYSKEDVSSIGLPSSDSEQTEKSLGELANACITCFINMMAGLPSARRTFWPYIKHKLRELLSFPSVEVNQISAALLHQFVLEEDLLKDIGNDCGSIIPILLELYKTESHDACYPLFCLKVFLSSSDVMTSCWKKLSLEQQLLALDILASFLEENSKLQIQPSTLEFLQTLYKRDSDCIFSSQKSTNLVNPQVLHRLLGLLCAAAASASYQVTLQKDRSLLITTLYLLKSLAFQTTIKVNCDKEEAQFLPQVGFKCDLIRLLACLVYRNKSNQDLVGELEGVTLLMENSRLDENNPLIREACIFALRNLLEGNSANQKTVSDLELQGVADNQTLDRLGLMASVEDGKIKLNQIPENGDSE